MKYKYLCPLLLAAFPLMADGQSSGNNYVKTVTYLDSNRTDSVISIQYYDGLGRPDQSVVGGANTSGKYLHSFTEYDGMGRDSKVWSPMVGGSTPEYISDSSIPNQSSNTYSDNRGFSEITYDALDRQTFVSTPGEAWDNKGKSIAYRGNRGNEVKYYTVSDTTGTNYYPANSLFCTESSDEDAHTIQVFEDLMGRRILERRLNGSERFDTYYVYNDINQLVYVLQPKYQEDPTLDRYAFQYTYDSRGRIQTKKLPGCSPVQYWYDNADRIIRMQDGILADQAKSRVYEYDRVGRVTRQSISNGSSIEYDELVNYYDNYVFLDTAYGSNSQTWNLLAPLSRQYSHGLQTGSLQRASNGELILSVFSYDDYGRIDKQASRGLNGQITVSFLEYNFSGDVTKDSTLIYKCLANGTLEKSMEVISINKYEAPHTKLLTSSLLVIKQDVSGVMKSDTVTILQPTYDDFGHVVANNRSGTAGDMLYAYDNLHGWLTRIQSAGGFDQKLYRESGTAHNLFNGSIAAMSWKMPDAFTVHRYDYAYDGLNRLLHGSYSETRDIGKENISDSVPTNPNLDYIPKLAASPGIQLQMNKYGEDITYDKNSNITSLQRYGMLNTRYFGLIDNLVVSYVGNQKRSVEDLVSASLIYNGASDFVDGADDPVEYAYNGNGALTMDLNKGITNIEYDLLGNPRKITFGGNRSIEYIYAADGRRLRTIHVQPKSIGPYPGGPKLAPSSGLVPPIGGIDYALTKKDSTDYLGKLILKNNHPSQYLFDGGYASFDADTLDSWHYYVQDYMGNNRMVVNVQDNSVEQETHYYPYGGVIGDLSTDENLQPYKFEGKELDRTFGLDWYDIQARQYDAIGVPGWNAVDPLAEKYYGISPYAYCADDPVNLTDKDGRDYRVTGDENSITISATIYIKPFYEDLRSYTAATHAANFWSGLSGKFLADGKVVNFDISVVEVLDGNLQDMVNNDAQGNSLVVDDSLFDNASTNGTTREGNQINVRSSKIHSQTPDHEAGHMLGLIHEDNGLMMPNAVERGNDNTINRNQIKTIINNAVTGQPSSEGDASAGKGSVEGDVEKVKRVKYAK